MNRFTLKYLLLFVAQVLLWNYFNFSQFLTVVILPVLVLCLPVRRGAVFCMLTAFATGFAADFLAGGLLGISSLALVPVGLLRRPVIQLVFGSELLSRGEDISFQRQGSSKVLLATVLVTALYLLVYIVVDSAGTRPLWVDAVKFAASLAVSTLVSVFVAWILCSDNSQKWK